MVVDIATGNAPPVVDPDAGKNPAAVALGRLGGTKGGKARAAALSKRRRSEIAGRRRRPDGARPPTNAHNPVQVTHGRFQGMA
jgi:hypothetical protein